MFKCFSGLRAAIVAALVWTVPIAASAATLATGSATNGLACIVQPAANQTFTVDICEGPLPSVCPQARVLLERSQDGVNWAPVIGGPNLQQVGQLMIPPVSFDVVETRTGVYYGVFIVSQGGPISCQISQ